MRRFGYAPFIFALVTVFSWSIIGWAVCARAQEPVGPPGMPQLIDMDRESPLRFGTFYAVDGAETYEFCLTYDDGAEDELCQLEDVRETSFHILRGHRFKIRLRARANSQDGPWSEYGWWVQTSTADANRDGFVGVPDFSVLSDQFGDDNRE